MQFSNVSHLHIDGLTFIGASGNGLNIDDGGRRDKPSHHIELVSITVSDLPKGNRDGIKLSGVTDFRVINAMVSRWGGSGVDMVGCHRGEINRSKFVDGGDSGIQAKGGSSDIAVIKCEFKNFGQRGVNIGGSTGREYFRPRLENIPMGQRFEAKDIKVEGCIFDGGQAPVAFVGVDGAIVRFNTVHAPNRWVIRILQETTGAEFVACRNGIVEDNLFLFGGNQANAAINIGPGTKPESFQFRRNFWYHVTNPDRSKPDLPSPETDGVYGVNPKFVRDRGELSPVRASEPRAKNFGAQAYLESDLPGVAVPRPSL